MKILRSKWLIIFLWIFLWQSVIVTAQCDTSRRQALNSISTALKKDFYDTVIVSQMVNAVEQSYLSGVFDCGLEKDEFCFELNRVLRGISKEWHLEISRPITQEQSVPTLHGKGHNRRPHFRDLKPLLDKDAITFGEVSLLPGNIGYLAFYNFNNSMTSRADPKHPLRIEKALGYLKNSSALIIDLRENGGGSVNIGSQFCSFFVSAPGYSSSSRYLLRQDSAGNRLEREFIFRDSVYPNRWNFGDKPVFVLIGPRTFSEAEVVAMILRKFNRNTILVGEITHGFSYGGGLVSNHPAFSATIPNGLVFDELNPRVPLFKNGIKPDSFCKSDKALEVAYGLAGQAPEQLLDYRARKVLFKPKLLHKVNAVLPDLSEYIGDFRKASIILEGGKLWVIYDSILKRELTLTGRDQFSAYGFVPISFMRRSDGSISRILIHFSDKVEEFRKMGLQ